jgi:hypothetical protein
MNLLLWSPVELDVSEEKKQVPRPPAQAVNEWFF